ncbi:MAG: lysozyme inhibitor LprI family protein [Pseudomonadota bacterium]
MTKTILAALALATAPFATASAEVPVDWFDDAYKICSKGNTSEIVSCVEDERKAWDKRMQAAYKNLRREASEETVDQLMNAQQRWVDFRDSNCSFHGSREGSLSMIEGVECLRVLTAHRAQELELMLME